MRGRAFLLLPEINNKGMLLRRFFTSCDAATAIEYVLIAAAIAVAISIIIYTIGTNVGGMYVDVRDAFNSNPGG